MSTQKILADYILLHELRKDSEEQMSAILKVFLSWVGADDLPAEQFTAEKISLFLADKHRAGRSSYYRRSLRNSLKALYRFHCQRQKLSPEEIRPVKLETLSPSSWTADEVARLVMACDRLPYCDRAWWRTFILVGYYSGLNAVDIHRIEKRDIRPNGGVPFIRSKTGKRVYFALPLDLVDEIFAFAPEAGAIWPLKTSDEAFRMRFKRLVRLAGIPEGTFKRLRKTSGTLVEEACPGAGHRHLGNERAIFEKHYEDRSVTQAEPTMPKIIDLHKENPR